MRHKFYHFTAMVCLVLLLLPVLMCRSDAIEVATTYQGKILKSDVLDDAATEEWTELTLDTLADLCVSFNTDPGWDAIFGFYFPGVDLVKKSATLMISDELGLYYIAVKQDGELRVLCNQHGYPFYANLSSVTAYWLSLIKIQLADINDKIVPLLQSIDTRLQNTFTRVAAIYTNTSRFLSNIDETSKDINTQFRDFVNGHTVDDLIGAIENISGGDHSGIVSLLGQIDDHLTAVKSAIEGITIPVNPAYDDTSLRALVSSIDKKLDELPGGSVTADLQPVVDAIDRLNENVSLISTLSVHKLFGVSVVPATSGLRYRDGVFTYWVTPDPILTMTALDWSFDSTGDTNGESGEIELPFETTGITLSFSDPALLEDGFYGCLATSDGELLEVDSGSFTEHNGKYLYTFSDLHQPSSVTLTIDSGNMELLAKDLSISAAHIVGHNGSTDKVAFYADGAYYDIPLMDADGSPCLMQAATFYEGYGTDYQSTLTRDADGIWHLTVGSEPDKLLSADCGAKLDAALTWNKDYTWFSWFYGYSASFQGWLSDTLASLASKMQIVVDNSQSSVDNVTSIVIDKSNNAFNVFYLTGEDGTDHSIGEVTGNTLSASGKLLNFLYKLCVEGSLSNVDKSISGLNDFYFDNGAALEGDIWD